MPNDLFAVRGVPEVTAELERVGDSVMPTGRLSAFLNAVLLGMQRYAIGIVHVDTGRLKNSIFIHRPFRRLGQALRGRLSAPVEYASFENARGGDHAFFDRTVQHEAPRINDLFRSHMDMD